VKPPASTTCDQEINMRPSEMTKGSKEYPDLLEDEMTLKWGVTDKDFDPLGKSIRDDFEKSTKFALVLSGRVVPTDTYVNVWKIRNASAVQEAWSRLGDAEEGEFGRRYVKLNDMLLEETQQIILAQGEVTPIEEGREVIYLRNRYWVESEDLSPFLALLEKSRFEGKIQRVAAGISFTGRLNVYSVYLALKAGEISYRPKPGEYRGIEKVYEMFDKEVAKHLPFHATRFRPYTPQFLIPTSFDPSKYFLPPPKP
jgi:hypothetical protein